LTWCRIARCNDDDDIVSKRKIVEILKQQTLFSLFNLGQGRQRTPVPNAQIKYPNVGRDTSDSTQGRHDDLVIYVIQEPFSNNNIVKATRARRALKPVNAIPLAKDDSRGNE
jgi:hypothetical protein